MYKKQVFFCVFIDEVDVECLYEDPLVDEEDEEKVPSNTPTDLYILVDPNVYSDEEYEKVYDIIS